MRTQDPLYQRHGCNYSHNLICEYHPPVAADASPVWFTDLIASQVKDLGTQTALARRLNVTQQTVSNWKSGKSLPQPPEAVRLAIHLDVDPVAFIGRLYPELDRADPLAKLRRLLEGAASEDVELVVQYAAEVVGRHRPRRAQDA